MLEDLHDVIDKVLTDQQHEIITAELAGMTYKDLGVSKKYWRYHRSKAFENIKQHLGDK